MRRRRTAPRTCPLNLRARLSWCRESNCPKWLHCPQRVGRLTERKRRYAGQISRITGNPYKGLGAICQKYRHLYPGLGASARNLGTVCCQIVADDAQHSGTAGKDEAGGSRRQGAHHQRDDRGQACLSQRNGPKSRHGIGIKGKCLLSAAHQKTKTCQETGD